MEEEYNMKFHLHFETPESQTILRGHNDLFWCVLFTALTDKPSWLWEGTSPLFITAALFANHTKKWCSDMSSIKYISLGRSDVGMIVIVIIFLISKYFCSNFECSTYIALPVVVWNCGFLADILPFHAEFYMVGKKSMLGMKTMGKSQLPTFFC